MILFADIATAAGKILPALAIGALGVWLLLPKPRMRSVSVGTFLALAAMIHTGFTLTNLFGNPSQDIVGTVLFWLFAGGAVLFGGVLVTQRNPARGAIAFAFVILSSCGLFLLLAAPFLMAATIIIYAGAIIVTFLFVLMLSHAGGPSDENDRTREPLLGSLAGFAFAGLVLLTVYLSSPAGTAEAGESFAFATSLPVAPLTATDREKLREAIRELDEAVASDNPKMIETKATLVREHLGSVVGYSNGEMPPPSRLPTVQDRLRDSTSDPRVWSIVAEADQLRDKKKATFDGLENNLLGDKPDLAKAKAELKSLRDDTVKLSGAGGLSARNVRSIGLSLYSEHLIAVELAGTLLLVATIGAVAIAQRKGAVA